MLPAGQARDGRAARVGDKVRVSSPTESWVKASDRIVARYAAEHGGVYDPAAHLARTYDPRRTGTRADNRRPPSWSRPTCGGSSGWNATAWSRGSPAGQWRVRADIVEPTGGPRTDASATADSGRPARPRAPDRQERARPWAKPWPRTGAVAMTSPYLTTAEAAEYLRYQSPSAIRTLKLRGLLRPAGRRGGTDLYRQADLDHFVAQGASASIERGRPDAPGRHRSHELELDGRLQADQALGYLQDRHGLSRARARDGSEDRHAERSESGIRGDLAGRGGGQAGRAAGRDTIGRPERRARAGEVRRLRDILVRAKARHG